MNRRALLLVPTTLLFAMIQTVAGVIQEEDEKMEQSREDELRQRRLDNVAAAKPVELSKAEQLLLRVETGTTDRTLSIRYKDFYPKFGGPRAGSGFGGGLRYYNSNIQNSPVSFEAAGIFSGRGYKLADVRFGSFNKTDPVFFSGPSDFGVPFDFARERPGVKQTRTVFFGDFIYRYFPQERFWGLGPQTAEDARTNYLMEDFAFSVIGGYEFARWFAVAAGAGLYKVDVREGTDDRFPTTQEVFDDTTAPGLDRQPDFYRLLTAAYFNYQDNPGNPHKGGIIGIFFSRYSERNGKEFDFSRFEVDTRHYLPLGSRQRVLAVRFYVSSAFVDEGRRVPFYLSSTLGGGRRLRGFPDFRFRDVNLAYLSAEYRWEPAPAFELALFYDVGTVFPEGYRFDRSDLQDSFGGGVRFKTSNRVILRFDVAKGVEGTRFQFSFGPSF